MCECKIGVCVSQVCVCEGVCVTGVRVQVCVAGVCECVQVCG